MMSFVNLKVRVTFHLWPADAGNTWRLNMNPRTPAHAGFRHQPVDAPDRRQEDALARQSRLVWLDYLLATLAVAAVAALVLFGQQAGAQSGPEIELQCPPGTPIASGSTDSNWGATYAQGSLYYRTVRVLNLGDQDLVLTGNVNVSGKMNCTTLSYHYSPPPWTTTMAPGTWQEFNMGVQPGAAGAWSFTLSLASNDATGGETPYTITFAGTAAADPAGSVPALNVVTEPIGGVYAAALMRQPVFEALDASGARDTSFHGPVTISLAGGSGSTGQLVGTLTVNAVNGLATFAGLSGSQSDSHYGLYHMVATAPGLADAHTQAFMIMNATSPPGGGTGGSGTGSSSGGGGGGGCSATGGGIGLAAMAGLAALLVPLCLRSRRLATMRPALAAVALATALGGGALAAQTGPEVEFQYPPGTEQASGVVDTSWGPVYAQENYHRTVRVINKGNAPLTLAPTFQASNNNCVTGHVHYGPPYGNGWQETLEAGQWQEFSLYLRPIAPGPWSFSYTINNDDTTGGESPYVISYSGTALGSRVGVAPALRVLTAPIGGLLGPGFTLQPAVEALDASGQRDTSFNGPVTIELMGGAGPGVQLTGTVTVNASAGVAAFWGLGATLSGSPISDVNVVFSSPGLAEAHSGFQVRNFTSGQGSASVDAPGCTTAVGDTNLAWAGLLATLLAIMGVGALRRQS